MEFEKTVPFDPGYSKISFYFEDQISYVMGGYTQPKSPHQKKFQLNQLKPMVLDLINKSTAFYLGCMLWGGFLSQRFKNDPKEVVRSTPLPTNEEELQALDCSHEAKFILDYINTFERDCLYYLNTPAKIPNFIIEILKGYIEFAQINNNFINVEKTSDVKLPKVLDHFKDLSEEQLDNLCEKIYTVISYGKIEKLLDLGFYKV